MQREEESSLAQESSAIIDYRIGTIESTIVEKNLDACGRFYLLRSAVTGVSSSSAAATGEAMMPEARAISRKKMCMQSIVVAVLNGCISNRRTVKKDPQLGDLGIKRARRATRT